MKIQKVFRFNDWFISKLLFNFCIVLTVLFYNKPPAQTVVTTAFLSGLYILSVGALGYLINDLFDIESDRLSGKRNKISEYSTSAIVVFFILLLSISSFPFIFILPQPHIYLLLLLIQVILFLLYSMPPIRLKKNFLGLITDALFSYVLPSLICLFIGYRYFDGKALSNFFFIFFISWIFLIGLRSILLHQQKDYDNDLIGKNKTFTTRLGKKKSLLFIKIIIYSEILSLIVLLFILPSKFGFFSIISLILFIFIKHLNNGKSFWHITDFFDFASKLDMLYNSYFLVGIIFLISIKVSYFYLFFLLIYIVLKIKDVYNDTIILFLFYKSKGAIIRLMNLFCGKKSNF